MMRGFLSLMEKNRNTRRKMIIVFLFFSVLVAASIIGFLVRPAYSAVKKADCGIVEHTHTSDCYSEHKKPGEAVLVCGAELSSEMLSHIHDDFCYDENGRIICPLPEYQHIHTDDCYDEDGVQICGTAFHQHGRDCFRTLGENDSAPVLDCGMEWHTHAGECYPDISVPEEIQETPAEAPDIMEFFDEHNEPDESGIYFYETENSDQPALLNEGGSADEEAAISGHELQQGEEIQSVTLQYKDENGTWITVTEGMTVPANTAMHLEVGYLINKDVVAANNNTIFYPGIPAWIKPDGSSTIYVDGEAAANVSVQNGNAVIVFEQSYLDSLKNAKIRGTFNVEGDIDWRELTKPGDPAMPPSLNVNFAFEDNLPAKYGNFKVEKQNNKTLVEEKDASGKLHTYLKYELKVTSLEKSIEIPDICITDVLSTDNRMPLNNVIAGNGYVGIDTTERTLGNSGNDFVPYETEGNTSSVHGKVSLNGKNNLEWKIEKLQPGETRQLTYYVELNEKYVGSGSAATLRNEATPRSGDYEREPARDEFTPKAEVDIEKTQGAVRVDDSGKGTIEYTVTVSANTNNSYTITNANIRDSFGSGMGKYVVGKQYVNVTITNGNTTTQERIQIDSEGFNVPIDELKPGERVTITYSLQVQQLYSHTNGDASFENRASFVGHNKSGKWSGGYVFKGTGVTTTVSHNQWMRKMDGVRVDAAKDITIGDNEVYNYGGGTVSETKFTVPENAQEYKVVVNEDGIWNMSGAKFNDRFSDERIKYTGYLKIEEFDQISGIGGSYVNDLLTALNGQTPTKTVWVNIDGRSDFNITPKNYGLDENAGKVYLLTYYAAVDPAETNIKKINISNGFSIEGTIGYGDHKITFGSFQAVVNSTLIGSASYDFDKESLFYEKNVYTSGNGEIYWLIRANGTLPKGLHIQDRPNGNSVRSDSLVGVYMGDKGHDFSDITSLEELKAELSEMEELEGGDNKYFYNIQNISSLAYLDGKDFAIFSRGNSNSGYLTGNKKDNNKIVGVSLSPQISLDKEVETNEIVKTWHFELASGETDKFYIYYTDSSNRNHYMHISEAGSATIDDTPEQLTVSINNNQIKIANPDIIGSKGFTGGEALNWYGDNGKDRFYSGWKNDANDANNWHYLGTLDETPRYIYKPQTITSTDDLDGKQFAIVTPGSQHSGLLIGENSGTDALTGAVNKENFTDILHADITRKSPLQKWTFQKINDDNDFYVYYEDSSGQKHYLNINGTTATTTLDEYAIKVTCSGDGRIKLEKNGYTLNWYGGGNKDNPKYKGYRTENGNNDLHYVAAEEMISPDSSNYVYSWSTQDSNGSIRINEQQNIAADKSMYIVLRTHPDKALSERDSTTFENKVGIKDDASDQFNVLDRAEYLYTPNLPLYKEGMVAAYWDGSNWTIKSDPNVNKNLSDNRDTVGKLRFNSNASYTPGLYAEWLLNVNWDGTIEGDVILTDHLDHKMEPVSVMEFYTSGQKPSYGTIAELENDPDWKKMQTHEMPFYYNEKTGDLKVAVKNLHKSSGTNNSVANLQLICRVTDPDVIFSGANSELTNTADLTRFDGTFIGGNTDTHVIKEAYTISKTSDPPPVKDPDSNEEKYTGNSNKMTFTVEINPRAEDLIADSDTLPVLVDEMSGTMELVGAVEVYKDSEKEAANLLKNIKYSTVVNEEKNNKQIIFDNLPDNTHLIIMYKTKISVKKNKEAAISNIAYWKDYEKPSKPQRVGTFKYAVGGTLEANPYPIVEINKRDLYDNGIKLGGAQFEIREVDTNGTVGDSVIAANTTGNDGKITISRDLSYNKVYQLKETKAPTDYVLDEEPTYFMIVNEKEDSYASVTNIADSGKITIDGKEVDVILDYAGQGDVDLELTVYNQKARIEVEKIFLDESGAPIESADFRFYGTYRFGLYYKAPTSSADKPVQILSITYSETGVSCTLDGKETNEPVFTKAKPEAPNFIYELNEKGEPIANNTNAYLNGYSFDVAFDTNIVTPQKISVKTPPKVTIRNRYHPIYMPSAGGMGLGRYYRTAFFAMMVLFSVILITIKVIRKRE